MRTVTITTPLTNLPKCVSETYNAFRQVEHKEVAAEHCYSAIVSVLFYAAGNQPVNVRN